MVWIYVLVEHQSRPDRVMGLRLLSYMVQLWESQRRGWEDNKTPSNTRRLQPIVPIVFYTGKRRWTSPITLDTIMSVPVELKRFVPAYETLFLNLNATSNDELSGSGTVLASLLRVVKAADASINEFTEALSAAAVELNSLKPSAKAEWERALHFIGLLVRHKRSEEEQSALFEAVDESIDHSNEVQEVIMTGAEALVAKGHKTGMNEGKAAGKELGRAEGRHESLLLLLEFKFGKLPTEIPDRLLALTESQVSAMLIKVLQANTLSEMDL